MVFRAGIKLPAAAPCQRVKLAGRVRRWSGPPGPCNIAVKLPEFIRSRTNEIVQEWENFARTCLPAAGTMDEARLRDHVVELVAFIADDMDSPQSYFEQAEKAQGRGPELTTDTEAETHAILRAADGFTIDQVMGEFRALRASILRLRTKEPITQSDVVEITRFNEAIDQMLSESIARHTKIISDDLRQATREKDECISTLSHELRSPVGAITTCSQILKGNGTTDPTVARVSAILARQTDHLARLLDDLLDVARISRKRIQLKLETTDIRKCVQDAVDANSQRAGHWIVVVTSVDRDAWRHHHGAERRTRSRRSVLHKASHTAYLI